MFDFYQFRAHALKKISCHVSVMDTLYYTGRITLPILAIILILTH